MRGGGGEVGNAGGARAAAGRRPATCPAPANHSPPPRPKLTRLRDYVSKIFENTCIEHEENYFSNSITGFTGDN